MGEFADDLIYSSMANGESSSKQMCTNCGEVVPESWITYDPVKKHCVCTLCK